MKQTSYNLFSINSCRLCNSRKLTDILSLGNHYLSDFTNKNNKPKKFPLSLVLCEECNLLQLKHTVPSTLLYTEHYGYKSGINDTVCKNLQEIVEKSQRLIIYAKGRFTVVDIGSNDGTLLNFYRNGVYRVGIEPVTKFAKECEHYADVVINDFFRFSSYVQKLGKKKAHIITAISCFYDMHDPNQFLSDVNKILHSNGIFVVQQNYLVGMLEQNAFDNIVHEHLEYYSLLSLENLLKRHDLEVFDVELSDINGGSFRTYIAGRSKRSIHSRVYLLRKKEERLQLNKKDIYEQFAKRVRANKKHLYSLIKSLIRDGKKIYAYGASTRGNTLLQYYGLNKTLIAAAVERNPEKWGKRIASVEIPIISEETARKQKPDYMLVLPWFFKKEFLEREKAYLKGGGHFIFPLPTIEII